MVMPSVFGHIKDFPIGSFFANRLDLQRSGLHRYTQAGISGSRSEAADAVVISGGYEDDIDQGSVVIYTGEGGNGAAGRSQNADQRPHRGNIALRKSFEEGTPVRVIRGSRSGSAYGPVSGYRYDGLYLVASCWTEQGKSGYVIYRFKLISTGESRYPPRPST